MRVAICPLFPGHNLFFRGKISIRQIFKILQNVWGGFAAAQVYLCSFIIQTLGVVAFFPFKVIPEADDSSSLSGPITGSCECQSVLLLGHKSSHLCCFVSISILSLG